MTLKGQFVGGRGKCLLTVNTWEELTDLKEIDEAAIPPKRLYCGTQKGTQGEIAEL